MQKCCVKRSYLSTPWKGELPYCTIPERLKLLAEEDAEKEAIIIIGDEGRIGVTFKEIIDGATIMARKMMKIGITKKDVVAIHDDKSPAWLFYTFGAQMCGAWPLHFYFQRNDGSDVAAILKRSGCKYIITQPGDGDEYVEIMKSFIHFDKSGSVQSEDVPSLKHVLFFRKPQSLDHTVTFEDILPSAENELPEIEPEDTAAIFCSSGSTGPPKLVPWSHINLIVATISTFEAAEINCGEPFFCDRTFGWFGGYPKELFVGVPRVTNSTSFKEKSISEICKTTVQIINEENCEHVVLFSTTIAELLIGNERMKTVRTILTGGGPISSFGSQLVGRFCQKFINMYGLTEIGNISVNGVRLEKEMKSYDTGQPIPGVEVKLVDNEGRLCEVGNLGEVYVRNKSNTTGYLHEEQDWHKTNRMEGYWFKTGDAGYISEDGNLFVAGRISESIMIEGKILSPSHFEDIFMKHSCVENAVAFGIPNDVFYEVAGVALTLKEGKYATIEDLRMFYINARNLNFDASFYASKFVPKEFVFFDNFPLTNSGKIARKLVKEMALIRIKSKNKKD